MPIELREGEQRVKEDKTKQEDVEEGEEVTRPPFSALSHMKIEDSKSGCHSNISIFVCSLHLFYGHSPKQSSL